MTSNNTTSTVDVSKATKSIVNVLNSVTQNFVVYLPLVFLIFGFIGFIGNVFTFLQAELRSNTCCIYLLCGSIVDIISLFLNSFPVFLSQKYGIYIPWDTSSILCKLSIFIFVFLPNLSINFLLMAIIDRFACTCSLMLPLRRLIQLKMVPWIISIIFLISVFVSIYAPILFYLINVIYGSPCSTVQPTTFSVLYIMFTGLMQPLIMLMFVWLTYRNVRQSRRRVGGGALTNRNRSRNQFIAMICSQVLTTAFFSLQWITMYTYLLIAANDIGSVEKLSIIIFAVLVTNTCYYLNNVKSFYLSILTSHLFRKTFFKALIELLPRHMRPQLQVTQFSLVTVTRMKRRDA